MVTADGRNLNKQTNKQVYSMAFLFLLYWFKKEKITEFMFSQ